MGDSTCRNCRFSHVRGSRNQENIGKGVFLVQNCGFWDEYVREPSGSWRGCKGRVLNPESEDRKGLGCQKVGVGRVGRFEGVTIIRIMP